jgi:hypothetical protein
MDRVPTPADDPTIGGAPDERAAALAEEEKEFHAPVDPAFDIEEFEGGIEG